LIEPRTLTSIFVVHGRWKGVRRGEREYWRERIARIRVIVAATTSCVRVTAPVTLFSRLGLFPRPGDEGDFPVGFGWE
jgi:hypothetical protein